MVTFKFLLLKTPTPPLRPTLTPLSLPSPLPPVSPLHLRLPPPTLPRFPDFVSVGGSDSDYA